MSRMVIRDIVIPMIEKIMRQQMLYSGYGRPLVQDSNLEEFLEEEMWRHFGVIGANECHHLREQIEQAMKNDPYAFEFLIRKLLEKYVKFAAKIRRAEGPPDRFSELRRKHYPKSYYG